MDSTLNRRHLLKGLGIVGLGGLAGTSALTAAAPKARATPRLPGVAACEFGCVVTPSVTEGPYYFDANQLRADVDEGRPGAQMALQIGVVNADTCAPIEGAIVDIWHCDATGLYSGYNQPGGDTRGEDFLRGIQITDANGEVEFISLYPGWYRGRTAHIHFKIRFDASTYLTSQLFFPQEVTDALYTSTAPYSSRGLADTSNAQDNIYQNTSNRERMLLTVTEDAGAYTASIVIGVTGLATASETTPATPQPSLAVPFPNPTPSVSTAWLVLPRAASRARVGLYDVTGREVQRLHDGPLIAGRHPVEVDASALAPGTYVVRADVGTGTLLVQPLTVAR